MTDAWSSSGRRGTSSVLAVAVWLFLALGPAQAASLTITTFAGPDEAGAGTIDGPGSAARFNNPEGVAVDGSGNVYVGDYRNHTIRKITPAGVVSTLAGLAGTPGSADGTGGEAQFDFPLGVAVDGSSNVYVADTYNHTIRKITPAGVVSTLAGLAGTWGSADGTGSDARFNFPYSVAVDGSGYVYVADEFNYTIRKITPTGVVSTLAGLAQSSGSADGTGGAARFNWPSGVAVDGSGNVYVADTNNYTIRKITPGGVVSTLAGTAGLFGSADGTGSAARFYYPEDVAVDGSGNVYVADSNNNTIRKVTPAGVVSTLAGTAGTWGNADGTGGAARFNYPWGVAVDGSGNVYVADYSNDTIRKIKAGGVVSTLAGLAVVSGSAGGTGSAARFNYPSGVAVDGSGNVYVSDLNNQTIRKITPTGVVSTLAGLAGVSGSADGAGGAARFYNPEGVAVDRSGNVYVADAYNNTIRKITPAGMVSTLAGTAGTWGSADGTGAAARFNYPWDVAVDGSGNVYVADNNNNTIRKITPAGVVTTLAGSAGVSGSADGTGAAARFYAPYGVAVDGSGNVYVGDLLNYTIRKVTPAGVVTTLAGTARSSGSADGTGSAARFNDPWGVAVDGSGNVYVADYGNYTIRKVTPAGVVSTLAGLAGIPGSADGTGGAARFGALSTDYGPSGVAVDGSGRVYVSDSGNNSIRKGTPAIADAATIDKASGAVGATRQLDTSPQTASSWQWSEIRAPGAAAAALSSSTVRNPTFTPDMADLYVFRLLAKDASGNQSISTVQLAAVPVGPAAQLAFTTQPGNGTGGSSLSTQPAVAVQDANGNTVTTDTSNVTIAISNNPGGGTLSGTMTVAAVKGVATFSGLSIDKAGTGYTLSAGDGALTGAASNAFNISVGPAAKLAFTTQPGNGTGGSNLSTQPVVAVQDAGGNTVTTDGSSVTLAIGINQNGGTLSGTKTVAASNGVATFSGLSIDKAGNGYTLAASDGALTGAASNAFNITVGPAAKLAFTTQPGDGTGGSDLSTQPAVAVQDAGGNTVTTEGSSVTLAIGTNPSSGALSGTKTVAASKGEATFSGLSLDKAGNGYTLTAADGTLTGATSSEFDITAGPAAKLAFTTQPGNGTGGSNLSTQPVVAVQDTGGNTVTTDSSSVTLAIGTNPNGGTLSGTNTVAASKGVAAFSGLSIDQAGNGYTLTATDGTLTGATSSAFNIAVGLAATPAFSLAAGTYTSAQSVSISCATSGATIYYTTDGSTPSASSAKYAAALNLTATITLKAYAAHAGMTDSAVASATYTVYVPNSGGDGAATPNTNATATNPVDGASVTVTLDNGGVVLLNVGEQGGALPPGTVFTTVIHNAAGGVIATVQGTQPGYVFREPGMYLAVVTMTDAQGNVVGETELALPISAAETGTAQGTIPPSNLGISAASLKGKLLFNAAKADTVTFKGTVALPAGLDLSKPQKLAVSLGNVVDTANLDTKGKAKSGANNRLKNVAVKYPRLKKPATTTSAGQNATVSFTLAAPQLDLLGFDCTGVSKAGGTAGQSVQRIIGAALVLGGTAYRVDVPVTWKLSKKGDNGQVTSQR